MTPTQTVLIPIQDGENCFDLADTEEALDFATRAGFSIIGVVPAHGHRPALVLLSNDDLSASPEPEPPYDPPPGPPPVQDPPKGDQLPADGP